MERDNKIIDGFQNYEARSEIIAIQQDPETTEAKKRVVRMTVVLDSYSPPRYSPQLKGWYIEKLSPDIFKEQGDLSSCKIRSFLNHFTDSEHLVGWNYGKAPNMKIEQRGNVIIADLTIDESNKKLKDWADKIELGVINSNSFIFNSHSVSVKRNGLTKANPAEITYNSGELISIDGVFEGFYPQASSSVLRAFKLAEETEQIKLKEINQMENTEIKKEEQETETQETETVEQKGTDLTNKIVLEKEEYEAMVVSKSLALKETETLKKEYDAVMAQNTKLQRVGAIDENTVYKKILNGEDLTQDEIEFRNNQIKKELEDPAVAYEYKQIGLGDHYRSVGLDGTSGKNGLNLAQIVSAGFQTNLSQIFPEGEMGRKIPIEGFNKQKIHSIMQNIREITPKAEGEEAHVAGSESLYVLIDAQRFAEAFPMNANLNHFNYGMAAETLNVVNSYIVKWRKDFYKQLIDKIETPYDTTDLDAYTGGLRTKAIITRDPKITGDLKFQDLDNMINNYEALYGSSLVSQAVLLMHTNQFSALELLSRQDNNKYSAVFDSVNKKYKGIRIIHSPYYVDTPTVAPTRSDGRAGALSGKKYPVVLLFKETVVTYGLKLTIADDRRDIPNTGMVKRYIDTRGSLTITDYGIKNKAIQI